MKPTEQFINRREFFKQSARGAGAMAVGSAALAASARMAAAEKQANPFAYDVDRFSKTDPKLIKYAQVGRFPCPAPEPRRIAIGPEDRLFFATRNGVSVLDSTGNQLDNIATDAPARCVAVAADGTVYVGLRDHVEVFDRKGRRLAVWESAGKKAWLSGLAVGENDVLAADSGNRIVLRYNKSGKLLGRIGAKSKERNVPGIILPSPYLAVALSRDGLVRLNNTGRHCVEIYTLDGDLELSWGKASAAIEGFCGCCNPIGLTLLPDGRYVTCEKGLPRVKIYAADGTLECVVAGPESFPESAKAGFSDCTLGGLDAAVDSQGRIYVLDHAAKDIRVMQRKA